MQVTGILLALLDMPAEHAEAYNRWYDLDHMPEHVAKDDILYGRRYVATTTLRQSPAIESGPLTNGHPPYATIYSFGGPLDFASEEATRGWTDLDRHITKAGRYWRQGSVALAGRFRLESARARPSVLVQERAVPHLAHRGIIVAIGRVASAEDRAKAAEWWDRTRLVDLFAVPGLLAALRFAPVDGDRFSSIDGDQAGPDGPRTALRRPAAASHGRRRRRRAWLAGPGPVASSRRQLRAAGLPPLRGHRSA